MTDFNLFGIDSDILKMAEKAERTVKPRFTAIEKTESFNQMKVLAAFRDNKISAAHFMGTSGYGYDDLGRDSLDKVFAQSFGAEAALVRHNIVSGTHAIAVMLFSVLRPGDTLVSIAGSPYDTLKGVISGKKGSLSDFGINYREVPLKNNKPDYKAIERAIDNKVAAVLVSRSKGYDWRQSLTVEEINALCEFVKGINPRIITLADNCYGEFVEEEEPKADLFAGSLIKNPGGGIAPSGGYIAGKEEYVKLAADRLTAPGIGLECGANLGIIKDLYMGFFMAPHTVAQALKCGIFCGALMQEMGYEICPSIEDPRTDIIQAVKLKDPEKIIAFCRGLQSASPIDSHVSPQPWAMPGYDSDVIMAAGTFTQGASIEISADAPIRPPYVLYMQGGLTYESGKISIMAAAQRVLEQEHKKGIRK